MAADIIEKYSALGERIINNEDLRYESIMQGTLNMNISHNTCFGQLQKFLFRGFSNEAYWEDYLMVGGINAMTPTGVELYFFELLRPTARLASAGSFYVLKKSDDNPFNCEGKFEGFAYDYPKALKMKVVDLFNVDMAKGIQKLIQEEKPKFENTKNLGLKTEMFLKLSDK